MKVKYYQGAPNTTGFMFSHSENKVQSTRCTSSATATSLNVKWKECIQGHHEQKPLLSQNPDSDTLLQMFAVTFRQLDEFPVRARLH